LAIAQSEPPDLVITDILMPTMDGYALVKHLRANPITANIPVIFYTANYLEQEARALAESCGVTTILTKPCEPQLVLDAVSTNLHRGSASCAQISPEDFDQKHLNLTINKLSQKDDEVLMVNLKLFTLIEISQRLASEHNPYKLVDDYCQEARRIIGAKWAAVGLLDEGEESFSPFFTSGLDAGFDKVYQAPKPNRGIFGELLGERGLRQIQNPDGKPLDLGFSPEYPPVQSFLGAAIFTPSRVYGCFCLVNKVGAEGFSNEDAQLALTLAAQLGVAYENALRYDEIQQQVLKLNQEMVIRQRAEAELQKAHTELEHRVIERTAELAKVNIALSEEIVEHKRLEAELEKSIGELQEASGKVKTLSGLLPICAWCKNIRDDTGYWHQVDSYISKHSETKFSHGLCPRCAEKMTPEIVNDELK
jgi:two-component system, cell cycle sensor histidine kinase and response regulator CckA